MGRPTEEKKNCTIIVRVSPDLKESLEQRALANDVKLSDYIRTCLEENKPHTNHVLQNDIMSETTYNDISDMCNKSMISTKGFFDRICELFNDGHIYLDGVTIKTRGEYDLGYLLDVCHRANVDPQEMINKLANSLVRR